MLNEQNILFSKVIITVLSVAQLDRTFMIHGNLAHARLHPTISIQKLVIACGPPSNHWYVDNSYLDHIGVTPDPAVAKTQPYHGPQFIFGQASLIHGFLGVPIYRSENRKHLW